MGSRARTAVDNPDGFDLDAFRDEVTAIINSSSTLEEVKAKLVKKYHYDPAFTMINCRLWFGKFSEGLWSAMLFTPHGRSHLLTS